jgi:hypothetical protein
MILLGGCEMDGESGGVTALAKGGVKKVPADKDLLTTPSPAPTPTVAVAPPSGGYVVSPTLNGEADLVSDFSG